MSEKKINIIKKQLETVKELGISKVWVKSVIALFQSKQ